MANQPFSNYSKEIQYAAAAVTAWISERTQRLDNIYIVGNSADFDFFAVPLIEALDERIVGVASITLKRIPANPEFEDLQQDHYTIPFEYTEHPDTACDLMLVCQSVIARGRELSAIISRAQREIEPRTTFVVSAFLWEAVLEELLITHRDLTRSSFVAQSFVSSEFNLRDLQDTWFESLDDRTRRSLPLVPRWVRDRRKRLDNDHSPANEI